PYIMKTDGCIHDGWLLLRPKDKTLDQDYLYYFLSSQNAYKQFDQYAVGSTVRNLNSQSAARVKIHYPKTINEQIQVVRKIEQINEQSEKLKILYSKKLKKLIMLKQSMLNEAL